VPITQANGIQIYYEIHGDGQPIVVIEGLSIDVTTLERIVSELAQKYRVIVFDNRGAGRSDKPDIPYSIEVMSEDTAALLSELKIVKANIIGISMGGRIAVELTLQHPELVKSLILVSTGAKVTKSARRSLLFILIEIPRRLGNLWKKYPQPNYAYRRQRQASENYDATTMLPRIQVPTLILHGKGDRIVPYASAETMHNEIKDSKIVSFKGGHTFFFWRQKEFIGAVEEFLESLLPGE
jgi:3-oxoadipate enol-lactonase